MYTPRVASSIALLSLAIFSILGTFLNSPYWIRVLTTLFMWIALAESWNTIGGYTGYIDFGHVAFFGIGAYATSILTVTLGLPFFLSLLNAAILAMIAAIVIGIPTLGLRGAYFAIATWAFAEMMKQLALVLDITGGAHGITMPPLLNPQFFYYLMFTAMLLMILTNYLIRRSKFGYNLRAIRESEVTAEMLGINSYANKLFAFALSAFFPGLIGGIFAYWITFIYPFDVFDALRTDQMVVMVLFGGLGTAAGPIIGATILTFLQEFLWLKFPPILYLIFLGAILVAVIMFLPDGIVGIFGRGGLRGARLRVSISDNIRRFAEKLKI